MTGQPFNLIMTKVLKFLKGKKTTIATILGLLITYCLAKGFIGNDEAVLLSGLLAAVGFGANVMSARLLK